MKNLALASVCGALLLVAGRAEAIPAFARATGMGCPACHQSWPVLNDFGELFRDRGYRVRGLADEPSNRSLDYAPIALRTTGAYQLTSTNNQETADGLKTFTSGGFAHPEADILFGENLGRHLSAFAVVSGFGADGAASLESAWARLNELGDTAWANLKVGKLEFDLPVSEHRAYTLTAPYLIYHYHPDGSAATMSLGDNQVGVELMGHEDGAGLRYAVSLVTSVDNPGAGSVLSSPGLYAHLNYTFTLSSAALPRVRVGALALASFTPTAFAAAMGDMPESVPGSGRDEKGAFLAGIEARAVIGSLARPLIVQGVWLFGSEDKGLIPEATRDAHYHGGFLEVDYTPTLELTFFGRLDAVFNSQQAAEDAAASLGDQLALTAGARYALWLSAFGSVAAHFEIGTLNTTADPSDNSVRAINFLAGLDLAI